MIFEKTEIMDTLEDCYFAADRCLWYDRSIKK